MDFWAKLDTPLDFFVIISCILVVFVNGSTDAPNAVFSVVSSGKLKLWQGALVSCIFNFLGVLISTFLGGRVVKSVLEISSLSGERENAIICLSCFLTVIVFGIATMLFGMPSSESHALMFSLAGATFASGKGLGSVIGSIFLVVTYMIFSCAFSFFLTLFLSKALKNKSLPYEKLLIPSCASLSFMHGVQDGQKFVALLLILLGISRDNTETPSMLFVSLVVATIMSISTLCGGRKILDSMSKISDDSLPSSAFISDLGSFISLLICSILGMPISTGNIKSFSIFAVAKSRDDENKKMISKIFITSLITLPICFVLGAFLYLALWYII